MSSQRPSWIALSLFSVSIMALGLILLGPELLIVVLLPVVLLSPILGAFSILQFVRWLNRRDAPSAKQPLPKD